MCIKKQRPANPVGEALLYDALAKIFMLTHAHTRLLDRANGLIRFYSSSNMLATM